MTEPRTRRSANGATAVPERKEPPNKAVDRALDVLDLFADGPARLSVSEVARALDLDKSTISRIVATFVHHGYLRRAADDRLYEVGPKAWLVGTRYRLAVLLGETARVAMADVLNRFAGTTGYVGVLYRHHVYYVEVIDGPEVPRVHLELGERTPMQMIALGRAMLAHLPADELADCLARLTPSELPKSFPTRGALLDELDRIHDTGYAINEGDLDPEIAAVGVPVLDGQGKLVGGIALDFMAREATPEKYEQVGAALVTTAVRIQRILAPLD
jgi:DNA-binding IclR family transcriptional regulator